METNKPASIWSKEHFVWKTKKQDPLKFWLLLIFAVSPIIFFIIYGVKEYTEVSEFRKNGVIGYFKVVDWRFVSIDMESVPHILFRKDEESPMIDKAMDFLNSGYDEVMKYKVGDSIKVVYLPYNPGNARIYALEGELSYEGVFVALTLAVIWILFLFFLIKLKS